MMPEDSVTNERNAAVRVIWDPQRTSGRPVPEYISVPRRFEVVEHSKELLPTVLAGLPLRLRGDYFVGSALHSPKDNVTADILSGTSQRRGDYNFVRADRRVLLVEHLQALEAYIKAKGAVTELSPEGFTAFFTGFAAEKGWEGVKCPV